jgi:hypothetical protein
MKRKFEVRIHNLLQEKGDANKRLRAVMAKEATTPAPAKLSLDVFDNTLDQVSEAHVKTSGHPSVDGLNDSLDNLVNIAIEQAAEAAANYNGDRPLVDKVEPDLHPAVLAALAVTDLTEDNRGLLLDASLHHIILSQLHSFLFRGQVVPIAVEETELLKHLFHEVSENGAT